MVFIQGQRLFRNHIFQIADNSYCKSFVNIIYRASDISRKKKQNFAGFSGANSRKNRPISRDFRGKKVKIRGTIGRFQAIFAGEKSKFAEKSAHFAGF